MMPEQRQKSITSFLYTLWPRLFDRRVTDVPSRRHLYVLLHRRRPGVSSFSFPTLEQTSRRRDCSELPTAFRRQLKSVLSFNCYPDISPI